MATLCRSSLAVLTLTCLCAGGALAQSDQEFTVTVSNTNNVVNGDTTNIPALIAAPGTDGISFIEALQAANATVGKKLITFEQVLYGRTIELTTSGEQSQLFTINALDVTIDGDLDGNGKPDITFAAARNSGVVFFIRSSRVTIRGLRMQFNFAGAAVNVSCADLKCDQRQLRNVQLTANEIANPLGSGIEIGPEIVRQFDIPFLTDVRYDDLLISGNTITVGDTAILVTPSVDAMSDSVMHNVTIERNTIGARTGVRVIGAHRISPPLAGHNNVIDGFTIDNNAFETAGSAISIAAADYGNSDNRIANLNVTNNQIRSRNGVEITAATEGKPQRVGSGNSVTDVIIANNEITATERGVTISGADLPLVDTEGIGFESNRVQRVAVRDNTITGYSDSGVRVWGAFANAGAFSLTVSGNSVEDLTIAKNAITGATRDATGVSVAGAESRGGSTARNNAVRRLSIESNRISGNGVAILIVGGRGVHAESNSVAVTGLGGNVMDANTVQFAVAENADSATANSLHFPRRRAVR